MAAQHDVASHLHNINSCDAVLFTVKFLNLKYKFHILLSSTYESANTWLSAKEQFVWP